MTRYRLSLDIIGTLPRISWNAYASLTLPCVGLLVARVLGPSAVLGTSRSRSGAALIRFVRSPATQPDREGE